MRPTLRIALAFALPLALRSQTASAQSYGLGDQVLTIGASTFHPGSAANVDYGYLGSTGYLTGDGVYVTGFTLPDGAEMFGMCADLNGLSGGGGILAEFDAIKLPGPKQDPGVFPIPNSLLIIDVLSGGYQTVCNSSPISYVFHDAADLDGTGVANLAHRVGINMSGAEFGAVRIFWRRQVSPAPATATFNDVPTTDGAFRDVEALVAAGVTAGCGGGSYCPDASVTRRQMAVFLSKALGLHWPS